MRHNVRANIATGSNAVVHHHGLTQQCGHLVGHHASGGVSGAARLKWHHELDGPCGPNRLGLNTCCTQGHTQHGPTQDKSPRYWHVPEGAEYLMSTQRATALNLKLNHRQTFIEHKRCDFHLNGGEIAASI